MCCNMVKMEDNMLNEVKKHAISVVCGIRITNWGNLVV